MTADMAFGTWLKRTQLKRVERKLRNLRARQRIIRDKESQLKKEHDRGAVGDDYQRRHDALHTDKGALTHEISALTATEERLKQELKMADEGKAASS